MSVSQTTDQRRSNRGLRILCPNGHLGFAPTKLGSFELGVAAEPDMIACDSGSCDCGPVPLGSDSSVSPLAWQTHDIEAMLVGARRLAVPMMIGSAGDTGTNSRVDRYIGIIHDLAKQHDIPRFKLGYFYSELTGDAGARAGSPPATRCAAWTDDPTSPTRNSMPPTASSRWRACIPTSSCSTWAPM